MENQSKKAIDMRIILLLLFFVFQCCVGEVVQISNQQQFLPNKTSTAVKQPTVAINKSPINLTTQLPAATKKTSKNSTNISVASPPSPYANLPTLTLDKSPNDPRQYQTVILPNGMKVLFIYSQFVSKSAMSISVGVGSLYNPEKTLGLAHYLQHMLFMGSKKYPDENSFASFIKSNSGQRNAFTSDTETNFYFEIKNSVFIEAVTRMINFFVEPLFNPQSLQRERNAVNQQFVLRVSDDKRRKWQVMRQLAQPPFSRFSTGNNETLSQKNIRNDLIKFYNTYYSSNIMTATIYSSKQMDEIKKLVIPLLEQIPNKKVILPELGPHYTKQNTGQWVKLQSIKDKSALTFYWPVDFLPNYYQFHVSDYISHVLGHEGTNSLFSYLKRRSYVSAIISNTQQLKTQSVIQLQIQLTSEGEEYVQEVFSIVMGYVQQMKTQKFIYDERKQKNMIDFQFKQKASVLEYTRSLASKMQNYPLKDLINSSIVYADYKKSEQKINQFLKQLRSENVIVILQSKKQLPKAKQQKYFGIKYLEESLPQRISIDMQFQPMVKNPFIPVNTTLNVFLPTDGVKVIQDNVYFYQDSLYGVSKGGIQVRIYSEQNFQFLKFYSKYLSHLLSQMTYPALTLTTTVDYNSDDCLAISIFGFTDTVQKLINLIGQKISRIHEQDQFQRVYNTAKDQLLEYYYNFYNRYSDDIANDLMELVLTRNGMAVQQTIQQFRDQLYKETMTKIKNFWAKNIFKWVIVGNFDEDKIKTMVSTFEKKNKGKKPTKVLSNQCIRIKQTILYQDFIQSQQLTSSTAIVFYQLGPYSDQLFYRLKIMKNFIDEPFFNELRTVRKMAYSLSVSIQNIRGVLGLQFMLASSTRDPKNISLQIKQFVDKFYGEMTKKISQSNNTLFEKLKKSLFSQSSSAFNNLKSLFKSLTKEVDENTLYWSRRQPSEVNKFINPIKVTDFQKMWTVMRAKVLQIYVVASNHRQIYLKYGIKAKNIRKIKQNATFLKDLFYCCNK